MDFLITEEIVLLLFTAGIRFPRGISMLITAMQTIQMVIGLSICIIVFYFKVQGRVSGFLMNSISQFQSSLCGRAHRVVENR